MGQNWDNMTQYLSHFDWEKILSVREDITCTLHDFTFMLLSVTVQDIETIVQNVETNGFPVNLMVFSY